MTFNNSQQGYDLGLQHGRKIAARGDPRTIRYLQIFKPMNMYEQGKQEGVLEIYPYAAKKLPKPKGSKGVNHAREDFL